MTVRVHGRSLENGASPSIAAGEEICLDYAMCDGSEYDEFHCACGMQNCRGRIARLKKEARQERRTAAPS